MDRREPNGLKRLAEHAREPLMSIGDSLTSPNRGALRRYAAFRRESIDCTVSGVYSLSADYNSRSLTRFPGRFLCVDHAADAAGM